MTEMCIYKFVINNTELSVAANIRHSKPNWLLCMHGIQSNKELFDDLAKQSFLSSFSLLAIDLIGFGQSSKPLHFSYDIQEQANIVEELVKQLKIKKLHIVGHSFGGMIGTLLLDPLAEIIQTFINMEGNLTLADCGLSKEVADQSFSCFQNEYNEIKSKIKHSNTAGCIERIKWLDEIPDFAFYKTSKSIVDWSASDKLLHMFNKAECPKLFIYGSENVRKTELLSKDIASAAIPNSGHFMLQSNPKFCYQVIQNFLSAEISK